MAVLAIDFDEVIHDMAHPVPGRKMGPPMPGVKDALETLVSLGHTILIHSCNNTTVIREWMKYWQIPFHSIIEGHKPVADVYIDDKALRFETWPKTLMELVDRRII
jgi:hypothetical protein